MENKSDEKLFKERIQKEMRELLFEVFWLGKPTTKYNRLSKKVNILINENSIML